VRRKFRVFYDYDLHLWRWECTLCWPLVVGHRAGPDGWDKIFHITIPRHKQTRWYHHQHVVRTRGRDIP
jgi:hypothetical protein